jgi:transcription elongation GreA/GreB family factor
MERMPGTERGTPPVGLWCRVTVQDVETDEKMTVTLVPVQAADPAAGKVSVGAPLAVALMGRQAGESVPVGVQDGDRTFRVLHVVQLPADPA